MALYEHITETTTHEWAKPHTPYGIHWKSITPTLSVDAWSLASRISDFPDNPDLVLEAIQLAKRVFKEPICIEVNHYNAPSFHDLFLDCRRVASGEPRLYSIGTISAQLELDKSEQRDNLSKQMRHYRVSDNGIVNWVKRGTDGVCDMLCVISTLSKLLQK